MYVSRLCLSQGVSWSCFDRPDTSLQLFLPPARDRAYLEMHLFPQQFLLFPNQFVFPPDQALFPPFSVTTTPKTSLVFPSTQWVEGFPKRSCNFKMLCREKEIGSVESVPFFCERVKEARGKISIR